MLTLLALMAQSATLDADPYVAARTCATATMQAADAPLPGFVDASRMLFYTMYGARARPAGKPLMERLNDMTKEPLPKVNPAEAKLLVLACEKRFPRPATVSAEQLPAKEVDRDLMCYGVLGLLQGVAQSVRGSQPNDPWLDRIKAAADPTEARLTDEVLIGAGLANKEDFMRAYNRQLVASLDLGEPLAVARACGVKGG